MTRIVSILCLSDDVADPKLRRVHGHFDLVWRDQYLRCPDGMTSDGGSIPRLARPIVGDPWQRPLDQAFLPHDAAFNGRLTDWDGNPVYLSFADSNTMLLEIGRLVYIPYSGRWPRIIGPMHHARYLARVQTIYAGVCLGGRPNYHGSAPT